jgi:hypothetical protein
MTIHGSRESTESGQCDRARSLSFVLDEAENAKFLASKATAERTHASRLRAIVICQKKLPRLLFRHLVRRGSSSGQAAGLTYYKHGLW